MTSKPPRALALALRTVLLATLGLVLVCTSACKEDTIEPKLFGSVFGEVLQRTDNVPVRQVTVSTNPPTSSVTTDSSGRFSLVDIPEGTYSLRAEKDGFLTEVTSVTVFGDVDANVIVRLENDSSANLPPSAPEAIAPTDGATAQAIDLTLTWTATDPDSEGELRYDVLLFDADQSSARRILTASPDTTMQLDSLAYGSTYFWQVIVDDGINEPVRSPVWQFTTRSFPNQRYLFARATGGNYAIYSADGLGSELQLTSTQFSSWRPRMNPQRSKIAFISNREVASHLYVMNRDGSDIQRVTTVPVSGADPLELDFTWSPDGTELLYMANSFLYKIRPDGSGLNRFAVAPVDFTFAEVDWTGQGGGIVARIVGETPYDSFILTIEPDGELGQFVYVNSSGATGGPMYSVSGQRVLFTHDVSGFESLEGRQLDARIFEQTLASNANMDLSFEKPNGTNDLDPIYSPDGSKILFVNTNNDGISRRDIYVMNVDGTDRELLFENAIMPEWK